MPIHELLNVHRRDRNHRALVTLSGEIDLHTAPIVRESLERCLHDGLRIIDIDLTPASFCDRSGLNTFLRMSDAAQAAGTVQCLRFPSPPVFRLVTFTGSADRLPAAPSGDLTGGSPFPPPVSRTAGPPAGHTRSLDCVIAGGVC